MPNGNHGEKDSLKTNPVTAQVADWASCGIIHGAMPDTPIRPPHHIYFLMFACPACESPIPKITFYVGGPQRDFVEGSHDLACSCTWKGRKSGLEAVHVTELSLRNGKCFPIHTTSKGG